MKIKRDLRLALECIALAVAVMRLVTQILSLVSTAINYACTQMVDQVPA